jgi:hypothetical protein
MAIEKKFELEVFNLKMWFLTSALHAFIWEVKKTRILITFVITLFGVIKYFWKKDILVEHLSQKNVEFDAIWM